MEACIVHAGPLPASVWGPLRAHLPLGTPLRLLDLDALTPYWEAGRTGEPDGLTVAGLAERLRPELDHRPRLLRVPDGPPGDAALARRARASGAADPALAGRRRLYVAYARARRRDRALA